MIYVTPSILAGLNKIAAAGHGVEIEPELKGGNNHTVTYIVIACRRPGEGSYSRKLRVRHISSYGGHYNEWTAVSEEFGDLCYKQLPSIDALVERATELA
jgi:hypothetical protein